jgi:hypothetical protein
MEPTTNDELGECQHDEGQVTLCWSSEYRALTGERGKLICEKCGARLVNDQWVEGTEEDKKDARWFRRFGKDPLDTPGVAKIEGTDMFLIGGIGEE